VIAGAPEASLQESRKLAFNFSRWSLGALFHYKSKVRGEPVAKHRVLNPYHAVSIATGVKACPHAKQIAGKRFLSSEAPSLPLDACDAAKCNCRYQHHPDRRTDEPRRETDIGIVRMEGTWRGINRRGGRGRRASDE
jgi:hypothetical protein